MRSSPFWLPAVWLVVVLGSGGCQKPYIITKADYIYYNEVTNKYCPNPHDDSVPMLAQTPPATVRNPSEREAWEVTLEEVKRIALEQNKQIAVLQYSPGAQATTIELQLSQFDPFYELGMQWARTEQQVVNNIQVIGTGRDAIIQEAFGQSAGGFGQSATAGGATQDGGLNQIPGANFFSIAKRNATGGLTRLAYNIDYQLIDPVNAFTAINPAWTSTLTLSMQQPLLQGAGVEFNRAPILIARANTQQAVADFEANVRTLLRDVELSYWNLYFRYLELYSREVGLKSALVAWHFQQNFLEVGKGSKPDLAQAREQYEFFRSQFIQTLNAVLQAEADLRELMGMPPFDNRRIIPADRPNLASYNPVWEQSVYDAMYFRPELASQRSAIIAAEQQLLRQQNGLLPDATLFASYSLSGLDNQFDQSLDVMTDNRFQSWVLALRLTRPIGERAAYASVQQAKLLLSTERARLRNIQHQVYHELDEAFRNLAATYDEIGARTSQREAAAEQLEAELQFFQAGKRTIDRLLEAQVRFADALRDEGRAIVSYNQALVQWEFARGTILESDNVDLAEERLTKMDPHEIEAEKERWWAGIPIPIHPGKKIHTNYQPLPDVTLPIYAPTGQNIRLLESQGAKLPGNLDEHIPTDGNMPNIPSDLTPPPVRPEEMISKPKTLAEGPLPLESSPQPPDLMPELGSPESPVNPPMNTPMLPGVGPDLEVPGTPTAPVIPPLDEPMPQTLDLPNTSAPTGEQKKEFDEPPPFPFPLPVE